MTVDSRRRRTLQWAGVVFALALVVYGTTAVLGGNTTSPETAYFDHLAEAFLSGRLHLEDPPDTEDLTWHDERWFVAFPPLPALLLLPWVALFGVEGTSTVWFSVLLGAVNVALVFLLLQALADRRWTRLRVRDNLWLTALFAVGSVHWYMAPSGEVWFVAQICTVTFVALAVWSAVAHVIPWVTGVALAAAICTRPHVALVFPLLLGILAERVADEDGGFDRKRWASWLSGLLPPTILAVVGLAAYNYCRFGSPLDFGYATMNVDERFLEDIRTHGVFGLAYVPHNLRTMFLALPRFTGDGGIVPDPEGMSIFFTTPALIYVFRAGFRRDLVRGAWLSVAAVLLLLLTYNNTGYWQFGYRFSLDFIVPAMVLLAVACRRRVSWPMRVLILIGVAVNLWGVRWWY